MELKVKKLCEKLEKHTKEQRETLIYMWVKTGYVSQNQFKELLSLCLYEKQN